MKITGLDLKYIYIFIRGEIISLPESWIVVKFFSESH